MCTNFIWFTSWGDEYSKCEKKKKIYYCIPIMNRCDVRTNKYGKRCLLITFLTLLWNRFFFSFHSYYFKSSSILLTPPLSLYASPSLSLSLSLSLFVCLSVCLSISLSPSPSLSFSLSVIVFFQSFPPTVTSKRLTLGPTMHISIS